MVDNAVEIVSAEVAPPTHMRRRLPHRLPLRLIAASVFVGFQFVMIFVGLGIDNRFFTWAPHDQQGRYEISVELDGTTLTPEQVHDRYRRSRGIDPRAIAHVFNIVEQYETTYGAEDGARVVVTYWVNGVGPQEWTWPR